MNILLTGATGFLGSRLLHELLSAGHCVSCAGRRPPPQAPRSTWLNLDFGSTSTEIWRAHLRGIDAVVNVVGIFRESRSGSFETIHVNGPKALFDACAELGIKRVVQVSALGADASAETNFLRTKYEADCYLLNLPLDACVAQPSLVFGSEGVSAQHFLTLASLPVMPLPAGGRQRIQPVHLDDAASALCAMVEAPEGSIRGRRVPLVGPRALMLREYLSALRRSMGFDNQPISFHVPSALMRLFARLGDMLPGTLLNSAAWSMLNRGNTADAAAITALLGRPPREASAFIEQTQRDAVRVRAQLAWLLPLLRIALAAVWLASGIVSLIYPEAQSFVLLDRAGVPGIFQPTALWGAALLDLLFGVLTLWWPFAGRRQWLWLAQIALTLFYSVVIALKLPEFWLHPYGPMTKNLPILALLTLLACLEREPTRRTAWST